MTRLFTSGAEYDDATRDGVTLSGAVYSAASPISGRWSWIATETTGTSSRVIASFSGGVLDVTYYCQARLRFDTNPATWGQASGSDVFAIKNTSTGKVGAQLRLDATGHPMLFATGVQRGSTGANPLVAGVTYLIELASMISSGVNDYAELRIDGVSIASISANLSGDPATEFQAGALNNFPLATVNITADDLVLNDSTTGSNNSWTRGVVVPAVPQLSVAPVASGSTASGSLLTTTAGTWTN